MDAHLVRPFEICWSKNCFSASNPAHTAAQSPYAQGMCVSLVIQLLRRTPTRLHGAPTSSGRSPCFACLRFPPSNSLFTLSSLQTPPPFLSPAFTSILTFFLYVVVVAQPHSYLAHHRCLSLTRPNRYRQNRHKASPLPTYLSYHAPRITPDARFLSPHFVVTRPS